MNRLIRNKTLCIVHCALCIVVLTGCRPRGVLSSRQMEDIFVDLHTADGLLQVAGYDYGHDEALRGYYSAVLEQHKTTQAQFDSSLVWYTAHPRIFDKIYPKVVARLEEQRDAYIRLVEASQGSVHSVDEWLNDCWRGYNCGSWQKKDEKNAEKFVYVQKKV